MSTRVPEQVVTAIPLSWAPDMLYVMYLMNDLGWTVAKIMFHRSVNMTLSVVFYNLVFL